MTSQITTIFFDVGDVLIADCIGLKFTALAKKYHISLDALLALRKAYRKEADLGHISDPEFWQKVLQACGITAQPEDWDLEPYYQEVPGTRDLVNKLLQLGYRLAIITDDSREMALARQHRYRYFGVFEKVIVSSHFGMVKPDEQIYRLALSAMGVAPEQSLFIDNLQVNLDGARQIGMQTVLFTDADALQRSLTALGVL
jgi:putative hydrolase of the HAD superfamily